jgi:acyl-coenzyme A synthetase/AMP-(fatty) acid ligase
VDAVRSAYHLEVPERYNAVIDEVEAWAEEEPEALALVVVEGELDAVQWSIGDLTHGARQAAAALMERRIGPGDVVLLALPRVTEWYLMLLGAIRIGAVPVALPTDLAPERLVTLARRIRPAAVVGDGRAAAVIDRHIGSLPTLRRRLAWRADHHGLLRGWEDVSLALDSQDGSGLPDDPTASSDPMAMVLTRGTSGDQRLVVQPHSWVLGDIDAARFWLDLRPGDMHWTMSEPDGWTPPWTGTFAPWHERATILQAAGPLDAPTALRMLSAHNVTSLCGSPARYAELIEQPAATEALGSLRHCTTTGAPLDPGISRAWRRLTGGLRIYEAYGQAESSILVANFRSLAVRPGSMGKPMPGWDVAVHDDDGRAVDPGVVGRLVVRRSAGSWHDTGDLARADEDGYLWFTAPSPS